MVSPDIYINCYIAKLADYVNIYIALILWATCVRPLASAKMLWPNDGKHRLGII